MPTYEYCCNECEHAFEVFQSMSAEPLRECPECGKPGLKRLIGAGAGLLFKGSGFYITDYKKSGSGKDAAGSSGGSESKSDTASPATAKKETSTSTSP